MLIDKISELLEKKYKVDRKSAHYAINQIISGIDDSVIHYNKDFFISLLYKYIETKNDKLKMRELRYRLMDQIEKGNLTTEYLFRDIILFPLLANLNIFKKLSKSNKYILLEPNKKTESISNTNYINGLVHYEIYQYDQSNKKTTKYDVFDEQEAYKHKVIDGLILFINELRGNSYTKELIYDLIETLGLIIFDYKSVRLILNDEIYTHLQTGRSGLVNNLKSKFFHQSLGNKKKLTLKRNRLLYCLVRCLQKEKKYKFDDAIHEVSRWIEIPCFGTAKRIFTRINKTEKNKNYEEVLSEYDLTAEFCSFKRWHRL